MKKLIFIKYPDYSDPEVQKELADKGQIEIARLESDDVIVVRDHKGVIVEREVPE